MQTITLGLLANNAASAIVDSSLGTCWGILRDTFPVVQLHLEAAVGNRVGDALGALQRCSWGALGVGVGHTVPVLQRGPLRAVGLGDALSEITVVLGARRTGRLLVCRALLAIEDEGRLALRALPIDTLAVLEVVACSARGLFLGHALLAVPEVLVIVTGRAVSGHALAVTEDMAIGALWIRQGLADAIGIDQARATVGRLLGDAPAVEQEGSGLARGRPRSHTAVSTGRQTVWARGRPGIDAETAVAG